jgi:hypothetical protein
MFKQFFRDLARLSRQKGLFLGYFIGVRPDIL